MHSASWGQQRWLPRGQPWRLQPAGGVGNLNAKRQNTRRPQSTGTGKSLICGHGQRPTVEPYCA